jgi:hypothetical protein
MATLYAYRCPVCQSEREAWREIEDRDSLPPLCGEPQHSAEVFPMQRLLSLPALRGATVART